jgi:5-(carboxyamino)imidazole ribonucleotide mutase
MKELDKYISKNISEKWDVVEIRVWSDSDFPRISELLKNLNKEWVQYILTINSAHRTAQAMIDSAKAFPEIKIPNWLNIEEYRVENKIKISIAIACAIAWSSAHIAGMTASETSTPIIALPVKSSAWWLVDSTFSMINMPPWIPNWFVLNQEIATKMVKKIYDLELPEWFSNIKISEKLIKYIDKNLLLELWLTIWESPIWIEAQNIEKNNTFEPNSEIPIIIPTITEQLNYINLKKMENIKEKWFYMWLTLEKDIRTKNALIYAAKIIWVFNPEVRKKVEDFSKNLTNEVLWKNKKLFNKQF